MVVLCAGRADGPRADLRRRALADGYRGWCGGGAVVRVVYSLAFEGEQGGAGEVRASKNIAMA